MIKVFFLIFEPHVAWEKIAQARRGFLFITTIHLLPLILAGTALETWGLTRHGKWQPQFQTFKRFLPEDIYAFEIVQFLLFFAMVFVIALVVYKISQTFQDRTTYLQAFTVVAYGLSPLFLFHFLDFGASVHPVVPWLLGVGLVIWILYQGIPRVLQTDPTHAFGVYFSTLIVVVLTTALTRLLTGMYLLGYVDFQHSWLAYKIKHLLGY